jgi:hypothetical protein
MTTDSYELPQDRSIEIALFTADQMREYARQAVLAERERCAGVCEAAVQRERERIRREVLYLTHPVAEFLYGHTREQAVEWAKEDKYDSDAGKADEILAIVAAAIRKPKDE